MTTALNVLWRKSSPSLTSGPGSQAASPFFLAFAFFRRGISTSVPFSWLPEPRIFPAGSAIFTGWCQSAQWLAKFVCLEGFRLRGSTVYFAFRFPASVRAGGVLLMLQFFELVQEEDSPPARASACLRMVSASFASSRPCDPSSFRLTTCETTTTLASGSPWYVGDCSPECFRSVPPAPQPLFCVVFPPGSTHPDLTSVVCVVCVCWADTRLAPTPRKGRLHVSFFPRITACFAGIGTLCSVCRRA